MSEHKGRDEWGKFARGNTLAKGNPLARKMHELRRQFAECVTPEDVTKMYRVLTGAAFGGDVMAVRLWLEYVVGKPVQAVEIRADDGREVGVPEVVAAIREALGDDQESIDKVAGVFDRLGRGGGAME